MSVLKQVMTSLWHQDEERANFVKRIYISYLMLGKYRSVSLKAVGYESGTYGLLESCRP
jgi:hypothetical protein